MWFLFSMLACTVETNVEPVPDDTEVECNGFIRGTYPENGAYDAYYRTRVEFYLSEPLAEANVIGDVDGTTELLDGGLTVRFTPAVPLEPDSDYTFALEFCGDEPSIDFHTSATGLPLEVPVEELTQQSYDIDLLGAEFVEGDLLGTLVAWLYRGHLLAGVAEVGDAGLEWRIATAATAGPDAQDECARTLELPVGEFRSPFFSLHEDEIVFDAYDTTLRMMDVSLEGDFVPDASRLDGVRFSGMFDGRELLELIGGDDLDAMCDLGEFADMPCQPCPDDAAPYCFWVEVDRLSAEAVPVILQEVSEVPLECQNP